jgi:hypothetical protein
MKIFIVTATNAAFVHAPLVNVYTNEVAARLHFEKVKTEYASMDNDKVRVAFEIETINDATGSPEF